MQTKVRFLKVIGTWREVADAARTTIRKEEGTGEPSARWKKRILLAEHSPIRKLSFNWKWENLPYWVSVHFVRHKFGIEHFVSTQRTDRTGEDRRAKSQDAAVVHECFANAQAVMFISRRRLCGQASPETRAAWKLVVDEIAAQEPEVAACCVPECVYRGFCPEFRPCGYCGSAAWEKAVAAYREAK
ncbi:MAG: thymidylate synthase ThyX [Kiritimatiellae bacterium]|nr:thymidylate synthase ThyX [Kiritimatiellia bacterium]